MHFNVRSHMWFMATTYDSAAVEVRDWRQKWLGGMATNYTKEWGSGEGKQMKNP